MSIHNASPAAMDPREFARLVKKTPAAELALLMSGERRSTVLDEIITGMPAVFRADVAGTLNAVVHWRIGGRPDQGVDVFELVIADGACQLSATSDRTPNLTLSLNGVDFLKLVTGNAHPVMLVMQGKLKTKGELALTAKFPHLFDNPRP